MKRETTTNQLRQSTNWILRPVNRILSPHTDDDDKKKKKGGGERGGGEKEKWGRDATSELESTHAYTCTRTISIKKPYKHRHFAMEYLPISTEVP